MQFGRDVDHTCHCSPFTVDYTWLFMPGFHHSIAVSPLPLRKFRKNSVSGAVRITLHTWKIPLRRSSCRCDESRSWSKVTKLRTVGILSYGEPVWTGLNETVTDRDRHCLLYMLQAWVDVAQRVDVDNTKSCHRLPCGRRTVHSAHVFNDRRTVNAAAFDLKFSNALYVLQMHASSGL